MAAFRNRGAAEQLVSRLAGQGMDAYLEGAPSGVFRVRVGGFSTREAARVVAARLEQQEYSAMVTTR